MDLKGPLVDTSLKIYPSKILYNYLETVSESRDIPNNILKIVKGSVYVKDNNNKQEVIEPMDIELNDDDIQKLNKIKEISEKLIDETPIKEIAKNNTDKTKGHKNSYDIKHDKNNKIKPKMNCENDSKETEEKPYLTTSDVDWLYSHLQNRRINGEKDVPFLHVLLEGIQIEMPENRTLKRNPVLEARCVKLRAQQEAREYRKMTKSVDNVRMRFPEDTISYQLKQVNRQLIAIGQFIISIFAGFLFGFRGVEWMVGNLDFGFRLLLGVMCALIIALAEIYFLAKKLNEELNIPETVQLGGPPKFVDDTLNPTKTDTERSIKPDCLNMKEHAD